MLCSVDQYHSDNPWAVKISNCFADSPPIPIWCTWAKRERKSWHLCWETSLKIRFLRFCFVAVPLKIVLLCLHWDFIGDLLRFTLSHAWWNNLVKIKNRWIKILMQITSLGCRYRKRHTNDKRKTQMIQARLLAKNKYLALNICKKHVEGRCREVDHVPHESLWFLL